MRAPHLLGLLLACCGLSVASAQSSLPEAAMGTTLSPLSSYASLASRYAPDATRPVAERLAAQPLASLGYVAAGDSLPEGMYLKERILWGERGLVRLLNLDPQYRRTELKMRRRWLQRHQQLGLITLVGMTGQTILGELLAANKGPYGDYRNAHKYLGYATYTSYMVTASFSIFAPPGRRYSGGISSIRIHRWLALVHFTGMFIQPWLGKRTADASSLNAYQSRLDQHKWVGRITYGAYLGAFATTLLQ